MSQHRAHTVMPVTPLTGRFRHPALFYRGADEFLAGTVPFVLGGIAEGEPVAVALPPENLATLAGDLGTAAGHVQFLDMTRVGRNPGWIIPGVLRAFVDAHPESRVRVIGQPIWPGRSDLEYPACAQHEALINRAFEGGDLTILCPYDADCLDPVALVDAEATHPVLIDAKGERPSDAYDPDEVVARYNRPLPAPPGTLDAPFDIDRLAALRRFVVAEARRFGLAERRVEDLELMVSELATNVVRHGAGSGTVRIWSADGQVGCEVLGTGEMRDPLAGRLPVALDDDRGRGLLLVNRLADLVRVHTGPEGTTVRLYLAL